MRIKGRSLVLTGHINMLKLTAAWLAVQTTPRCRCIAIYLKIDNFSVLTDVSQMGGTCSPDLMLAYPGIDAYDRESP